MTEININIIQPKQAKKDLLTIDIVVRLPSALHRVSKLIYGRNELFLIPTTHKSGKPGIDMHMSYHRSGEIHGKLTRGKLRQAIFKFGNGKSKLLKVETLGEATPTAKDSEILLWKKQGTSMDLIEDVLQVNADEQGTQGFINIEVVAATYPILQKSDADYIFEIDAKSTPWIDTKYFLIKPGKVDALKRCIKELVYKWNDTNTKLNWQHYESMTVEKVELFTNLNLWLSIVLFSKKARGSKSFPSGHPL